jgi:hypothetical protein
VYGKFDLGSRIANVILYTVLQYAVSVKLQRRCHVDTLNRRSGLMKEDDRRALVSSVAKTWVYFVRNCFGNYFKIYGRACICVRVR